MANDQVHDTRTTVAEDRVAAAVSLSVAGISDSNAGALVVFDFNAGDTVDSATTNDIGFYFSGGTGRPTVTAPNGSSGLRFGFGPDEPEEDSMQELRYELNGGYFETYEKISLYIPANYVHRYLTFMKINLSEDVSGWEIGDAMLGSNNSSTAEIYALDLDYVGDDGPEQRVYLQYTENFNLWSTWGQGNTVTNTTKNQAVVSDRSSFLTSNNKFSIQWQGTYQGGGGAMLYETQGPNPTTRPTFNFQYFSGDSPSKSNIGGQVPGTSHISLEDLGQNVDYIIHRKRSSALTPLDGETRVWKRRNGEVYTLVFEATELGPYFAADNNFERGYLLGWANSGFRERTEILLRGYSFYGANRPLELGDL